MENSIPWYTDASLIAPNRVYCVGSLAQCVRKWATLAEIVQAGAYIRLAKEIDGRARLERDDIAGLASNSELKRV